MPATVKAIGGRGAGRGFREEARSILEGCGAREGGQKRAEKREVGAKEEGTEGEGAEMGERRWGEGKGRGS